MSTQYTQAPHRGGSAPVHSAPNAALLIDFDNVTMGMRSDLSKDLKKLLQSDIIRGKVTVQRAYADWRRYPQYIVPLSENSIDLIFAPAYGSSKKNATDIRMAIDGMELVFTRPEIGTYILLTGDSDFSSLVLKLKEYGKYVIGVGIQESSSDILVQNCDEYYSYTNLAGLQKTDEAGVSAQDPWVLTEKAVKRMNDRDDVMRSDRLKQVMMELDPAFDEGNFGFSKFSKFLTEAASRGLVHLKKMENGQYEISPGGGGAASGGARRSEERSDRGRRSSEDRGRRRNGGRGRGGGQETAARETAARKPPAEEKPREEPAGAPAEGGGDPLQQAYGLLRTSLERLLEDERDAIRDSDVKRKMLELDRSFDESELGFSKFSRFLRQAHDHEVVTLRKRDSGNYEVSMAGAPAAAAPAEEREEPSRDEGRREPAAEQEAPAASEQDAAAPSGEPEEIRSGSRASETVTAGRRLGPRRGSTRRRGGEEDVPPLFEGQVVDVGGTAQASEPAGGATEQTGDFAPAELGLPTDAEAAKRYLANSYKGVGVKTAEALVDSLGDEVFDVLLSDPDRIYQLVPSNRADTILDAWREDFRRRKAAAVDSEGGGGGGEGGSSSRGGRRRTRRGGRR